MDPSIALFTQVLRGTIRRMTTLAFDTHKAVKALKEAGFDDSKAEAVVATVGDAIGGNIATKADIAELHATTKADITELRIATKADIAELRIATKADIAELRIATKADIAELRAGNVPPCINGSRVDHRLDDWSHGRTGQTSSVDFSDISISPSSSSLVPLFPWWGIGRVISFFSPFRFTGNFVTLI